MIDLGPHTVFIVGSYAVATLAIGAVALWIISDGRRLKREAALLEAKGVRRRSRQGAGDAVS
jgi:heme exporter protein CcmD